MSTFEWKIRVYYEDTDSGGVVYYANYLKFMERARTEWMRVLGFEQDRLLSEFGILFVVRAANLEYLQPARLNDQLSVSVAVGRRGRASLAFSHTVTRQADVQQTLCTGEIKVVCVNADSFRSHPIPEDILQEIPDGN